MANSEDSWKCVHCYYTDNELRLKHCLVCDEPKASTKSLTPKTTIIRNMIQQSIKHKPKLKPSSKPSIIGRKRRRTHNTHSVSNPKPPKRAKTPQLIHDEEEDDVHIHSSFKHHQSVQKVLNTNRSRVKTDSISIHKKQSNSNHKHPQRTKRSDKEEMDADDEEDDDIKYKQNRNQSYLPRIDTKNSRYQRFWSPIRGKSGGIGQYSGDEDLITEQIRKYNLKLREYTDIENELKGKYERNTMDLLQEISERKAFLLNKMDDFNELNDGKRWYPMMHYCPSNKRYRPDVHRFGANEYEIYKERLNEQIIRDRVREEMNENESLRRTFEVTNDKMWTHLLRECDAIKQRIRSIGLFYHLGNYEINGDIWAFENEKQKHKYGESLSDVLKWYNTHENKTFNDDKFGTILLRKCNDERNNRECGYVAEFKRVNRSEYEEYKRQFREGMKDYTKCTQGKAVYNRVIKMDFGSKKKRKIGNGMRNGYEPLSKRRRIVRNDDNSVVLGRNRIVNDGKGNAFSNFLTPK